MFMFLFIVAIEVDSILGTFCTRNVYVCHYLYIIKKNKIGTKSCQLADSYKDGEFTSENLQYLKCSEKIIMAVFHPTCLPAIFIVEHILVHFSLSSCYLFLSLTH